MLAVEIHHHNLDQHAGQKRISDEATEPLCEWHHQGKPRGRFSQLRMAELFGPSMKHQPKLFRITYGTDPERLAEIDEEIRKRDAIAEGTYAG